ncbi:MAG: aspartate kinase [Crocinitomicaceae bacterium]|nr:aspartate kinase [Crocinitomicaceae bacterium]
MRVFKFGGASVKDAEAVRNVADIIQNYGQGKLIVVISAMGKTTNKMEEIVAACTKNKSKVPAIAKELKDFHLDIMGKLFSADHPIFKEINSIFNGLEEYCTTCTVQNHAMVYDQVVSLGEVISTKIVEAFVKESGLRSQWFDARKIIRTSDHFKDGKVDWDKTKELYRLNMELELKRDVDVAITQGFIGHTENGDTTTLGREGSDFTAGILAFVSDSENVTIWKDVPGMLNADPKWFDNTIKLDKISFREAIELSYFGASVIHPKTIKPLQNKNIPLFIKSFVNPDAEGTLIQESIEYDHIIPSFIFKMDQMLISISPKDFSFIDEICLTSIFDILSKRQIKINLMQNSAISFSICVDRQKVDIKELIEALKEDYLVRYNDNLELVTIRHYDDATIDRVTVNKEVILVQKTRHTARLIMKDLG